MSAPTSGRLVHVLLDPDEPADVGSPKPRRRRGRPRGSLAQQIHAHVGADEFAFLRAVAQGIDVVAAIRHYMLDSGRIPSRGATEGMLVELVDRVRSAASQLDDDAVEGHLAALRGLATGSLRQAAEHLGADEPVAPTAMPAEIPSLEEFASRFPEGMYSEAELVELFEEEYSQVETDVSPESAVAPSLQPMEQGRSRGGGEMNRLLEALDWLGSRLAVAPDRSHPHQQWLRLKPEQQSALHRAGVLSLGNLIDWIALRGRSWFKEIPRYGVTRARRLEAWLSRWQISPAPGLPRINSAIGVVSQPVDQGALVPLTQLVWPAALKGESGVFRTRAPNSLGARNDVEAVQAWFDLLRDNSEATQAAYRRSVERLVLWAVLERSLALSSLTTADLMDFKDFLRSPPAHWIQQQRAPRLKGAIDWRPLRGPLKDKSLKLTFAAISAMFSTWQAKHYVTGNPASGIIRSQRSAVSLDVMRSFSTQDEKVIAETFDAMEDGPYKRRLLALVRLLQTAGLRREEAETATWKHMSAIRIGGAASDSWALEVLGKGKRERLVPINAPTLEALRAHLHDRMDLVASGKLQLFKHVDPSDAPLIGVLDERWILAKSKMVSTRPAVPYQVGNSMNKDGGLTAPGMYAVLKAFFRKCAVRSGSENSDFLKASGHWLRHTFAHHALRVSNKDLAVVQQLLGHASITTTAIYVKADMESRVDVVRLVKSAI